MKHQPSEAPCGRGALGGALRDRDRRSGTGIGARERGMKGPERRSTGPDCARSVGKKDQNVEETGRSVEGSGHLGRTRLGPTRLASIGVRWGTFRFAVAPAPSGARKDDPDSSTPPAVDHSPLEKGGPWPSLRRAGRALACRRGLRPPSFGHPLASEKAVPIGRRIARRGVDHTALGG